MQDPAHAMIAAIRGKNPPALVAACQKTENDPGYQSAVDKALGYAANANNYAAVEYLLGHGAKAVADDNAALCIAAENGYADIARRLLLNNADLRKGKPIELAAENGHKGVLDECLISAAFRGNLEMVKRAVDLGANVNAQQNEAFIHACSGGHVDIANYLISKGADIKAQKYEALRQAVDSSSGEIVELLLNQDAYKNDNVKRIINSYLEFTIENFTEDDDHRTLGTIVTLLNHGAVLPPESCLSLQNLEVNDACKALLTERHILTKEHIPDEASRRAYDQTTALVNAYTQGGDHKAARALLYPAIAMAATLGDTKQGQVEFARRSMASLHRREHLSKPPNHRSESFEEFIRSKQEQPLSAQELKDKITRLAEQMHSGDGYLRADFVKDMAGEFADAVLLPQLLIDARIPQEKLSSFTDQNVTSLSEKLLPLAGREILADKSVPQMLDMEKEWHIAGNALPAAERPLRGGSWHKLFDDIEYKPKNGSELLTITCLNTQSQLYEEGHNMLHCIGKGNYGPECLRGVNHVISIRKDKTILKDGVATVVKMPIATAYVEVDQKGHVTEKEFQGYDNKDVPKEARTALDWFKDLADKGKGFTQ